LTTSVQDLSNTWGEGFDELQASIGDTFDKTIEYITGVTKEDHWGHWGL